MNPDSTIRHILAVVTAITVSAVAACAQSLFPQIKPEKPDMAKVQQEITDRTSPYYYPRLMEQYFKNDTVMKLDKYRRLYLGYMLQEDYDPYRRPYPVPERIVSLYAVEKPTRAQCDSIIKYANLSLENDPFDMIQIQLLQRALLEKGNVNLAKIWDYKLRYLLMAIVSTGTGLDEESAWYVINAQHEYALLNTMGYKVDNHLFYEPCYEYITVEDSSGRDAGGYYFNIGPLLKEYYRKHPEDLEYESDGAD